MYGLSAIVMAFSGLGTKFLTYDVDYWCSIPSELRGNISVENWLNLSAPYLPDESSPTYDRCHIFNVNYTEAIERPSENTSLISCSSWEFAQEPFTVILFGLKLFIFYNIRLKLIKF